MIHTRIAFALCALLAVSSLGAQPQWNQYRGPRGDGVTEATGLPLTFGEKENLKWKTPLEGKAWSSPVVWDKQIWLTNATPDGKKMWVVCVDLDSGKVVHNVLVFENEKPQFCHDLNSYGTPTPVVEAGRVYVHFGVHGTACLDTADGKVIWQRRDLPCNHWRGPASSPIVDGDLLYILFDGHDLQYVAALNKKDGTTAWKKDRAFDYKTGDGDQKKAYCTPQIIEVAGRRMLITPAAVATEAFDPKTGDLLWTVRHGGMNASARPIFGNGLVYITNGMGKMVAVKPSGSGDISKQIAWESGKAIPKKSSPLLVGDVMFMISDNAVASCVDAKTGDVIWSQRIDGNDYAASPILSEGRIYAFSTDGTILVFEASRQFKQLAKSKLDSGFMASPAVAGKALILRTKTHLYRFEK